MPILIKVVLRNFGRLFPSLYFGMLPKFTGYIVDFQKLLISFEENSGNLRPFMDMKNTVIYLENNSKLLWKFVTIRGYEEQCFCYWEDTSKMLIGFEEYLEMFDHLWIWRIMLFIGKTLHYRSILHSLSPLSAPEVWGYPLLARISRISF